MPKKDLTPHQTSSPASTRPASALTKRDSLLNQTAVALQRIQSLPRNSQRPQDILALQRTAGNRAVQRMLAKSSTPSTAVIQQAKPKKTAAQKLAAKKAAAKKRKREKALRERLRRTNLRNQERKAKPKNERFLTDHQEDHNYGYDNTDIKVGFVKGKFRRGWGSQPFLTTNKDDYNGAVVKSDYDSLVSAVEDDKHSEQVIARDIIRFIRKGKFNKKRYTATMDRTISTFVQLTQFIEPHQKRIGGSDKLARASFERIGKGDSTFQAEFNRKDGNFAPARAKGGGSKFGGQDAGRALFDTDRKSGDKATDDDVLNDDVYKTIDEMSESSEDESSESENESDVDSDDSSN